MNARVGVMALSLVVATALPVCGATVVIGGQAITGPPAPTLQEGLLWGPLAEYARAMGAEVTWEEQDGRLTIATPAGRTLIVKVGEAFFWSDTEKLKLPAETQVADGQLICPLAEPLRALGCRVDWDDAGERLIADFEVLAMEVRGDDEGVGIFIKTAGPVKASTDWMKNPERAFVDLPHVEITQEPYVTLVNQSNVRRVRFDQFKSRPAVARFVMDLIDRHLALWRPRPDGCGGTLIMGHLDGDEPLIDRRSIEFKEVISKQVGDDRTIITCRFTGPIMPIIDVSDNPPQVIVSFPDVTGPSESVSEPVEGDFVRRLAVAGEEQSGWTQMRMDLRQLIRLKSTCDAARSEVTMEFRRDRLQGQTIVIDPGHGGRDSGARGRNLLEKEVNLDVAKRVVAGLLRAGARPILTRDEDVFVDLFARPEFANQLGADVFLSIHCNAMPHRDTNHGTETYWYTRDSKCLATIVHRQLLNKLQRKDNGVRRARFVVVRETTMPSCLVELMYLNHREEEKLLVQDHIRQLSAVALVEGLRQYIEGTDSLPSAMRQPAL